MVLENSAGARRLRLATLLLVNVTAIDPGLDPDHTVGGTRFSKAVVDIRAQGVQRKPPLQIPLGTRDLVAVQAAGDANLDALAAKAQCRIDPPCGWGGDAHRAR